MNKLDFIGLGALIFAIIVFGMAIYFKRQGQLECEKKILEQNSKGLEKIYEDTKKVYKRKAVDKAIDTNSNLEWLRVSCSKDFC